MRLEVVLAFIILGFVARIDSALATPTDLELRLNASFDPSPLGSSRPLLAEITNLGPATATGVRLFWLLPEGVELLSSNLYPQGSCAKAGRLLRCNLGGLGIDQTIQITLDVRPGRIGTFHSVASVISEGQDSAPDNNNRLLVFAVGSAADLELRNETDSELVIAGTELVYHLRVTNRGPSTATAVVVRDESPPGVILLEGLPGGCQVVSDGSEPEPGRLRCEIGSLAPMQSARVDLPALSPAFLGEFLNHASVEAAELDPDTSNNQATSTNRVAPEGDLNADGVVDLMDLSALIRELNDGDGEALEDVRGGDFPGGALFDVNGDGSVNEADVRPLMARILRRDSVAVAEGG